MRCSTTANKAVLIAIFWAKKQLSPREQQSHFVWPIFLNFFGGGIINFPINVHKWIGTRNLAKSCPLHLKHRKFTGPWWVQQFLQVSSPTSPGTCRLLGPPSGWTLQPKFSRSASQRNVLLFCCFSNTPGPKYFATALSHSAAKACFRSWPAYSVSVRRCLAEDLWVAVLLLFASLALPLCRHQSKGAPNSSWRNCSSKGLMPA